MRRIADRRMSEAELKVRAITDRRVEHIAAGVQQIAEALRDDTALQLAGQRELGQKLEASVRGLAGAVEHFARAVEAFAGPLRMVAASHLLRDEPAAEAPDGPAAETP